MKHYFSTDKGNLYCVIIVENDLERKILENFIPTLNNLVNDIITSLNLKLKKGEELSIKNITVKDLVPDEIFQQQKAPKKK